MSRYRYITFSKALLNISTIISLIKVQLKEGLFVKNKLLNKLMSNLLA